MLQQPFAAHIGQTLICVYVSSMTVIINIYIKIHIALYFITHIKCRSIRDP